MFSKSCVLSIRAGLSFLAALALPLHAGQWDLGDSAIAQLEDFHEGMAAFKLRGNWGFVDRAGKVAVEPQYDEVAAFSEGLAAVSSEKKWGFIDKTGKPQIPVKYEYVLEFSQGLAGAKDEGGKWGYLAPDGHWALPPKFEDADNFQDGYALVEEAPGQHLLIDRSGNVIKRFSPEFDVARKSGVLVVTRKPLPVLVTVDGQISPLSAEAENVTSGAGLVVSAQVIDDDMRYGLKDREGQWVIAPTFAQMREFKGDIAVAGRGEALGFVDKTGKFIVQPVYKEIEELADGRYLAYRETPSLHRDVFDRHGKLLLSNPCRRLEWHQRGSWTIFEGCQSIWVEDQQGRMHLFSLSQPEIAHAGEYLLIQSTSGKLVDGRLITPFTLLGPQGVVLTSETPEIGGKYDWAMLIEGAGEAKGDPAHALPLAMLVGRDGGVAIITRDHRIVQRPEWRYDPLMLDYSQPSGRVNGPMIMKTTAAWGAIDAQGAWIVQPAFERLHAFSNDIAQATLGGQEVVYGRSGKHHELPAGFRLSECLGAERFVLEGQKEGAKERIEADLATGEVRRYVVDRRFDNARGGLAPVYDGKWGMIDATGKWVVPPSYENQPEALMWDSKLIGWKTYRYEKAEGGRSLYGLLSPDGKEIIKPAFERISVHEKTGLLEMSIHGRHEGLMRADGREILPALYRDISYRDDGRFKAEPVEQKGLMSLRGEWILEPGPYQFNDLERRPYSREKLGEEDVYIDVAGRISSRAKPLAARSDNPDDWDRREEKDKSGKIRQVFFGYDWKPRVRLPEKADKEFSAGFLDFEEFGNGKYRTYLADHRGKLVSLNYDTVGRMSDGLAVVEQRSGDGSGGVLAKYGYIDRLGKTRIPPRYERAGDFSEGRAIVVHKGNYGVIDNQGNLILHSAWLCGQYPVLLDGKEQIIWPTSGLQECRSPAQNGNR